MPLLQQQPMLLLLCILPLICTINALEAIHALTQAEPLCTTPSEHAPVCMEGKPVHIPKIALLFIVHSSIPHRALWDAWLQLAANKVPRAALRATCNPHAGTQALAHPCNQTRTVTTQQLLYSIYVHTNPDTPTISFPATSAFHGRVLQHSLPVRWFSWSFVEVMRFMVSVALCDPANQRLVFVSDSCVPLYSPTLVYQQLMHENKSRLNACHHTRGGGHPLVCADQGVIHEWACSSHCSTCILSLHTLMCLSPQEAGVWRWNDALEGPLFRKDDWRKSMTWTALTAPVAKMFATEQTIAAVFEEHCNGGNCPPEEHYLPSMLAAYGKENWTACTAGVTLTTFDQYVSRVGRTTQGGAHTVHPPTRRVFANYYSHRGVDGHADVFSTITDNLLDSARNMSFCVSRGDQFADLAFLHKRADQLFVDMQHLLTNSTTCLHVWALNARHSAMQRHRFVAMSPKCMLFFRKVATNATMHAIEHLSKQGVVQAPGGDAGTPDREEGVVRVVHAQRKRRRSQSTVGGLVRGVV